MMLLLLAGALYVGNKACEPCHAKVVQSYGQTAMARSSGKVTAGNIPAGAFRHNASASEYTIRQDGAVHVSTSAGSRDWTLDQFIGSGAAGRSFLVRENGFVFQAPVTWYSQEGRWNVSPGYEQDTVSRWSRAIQPECLGCHASQIRFAREYQNLYADPPFAQDGIGCERCHGPGSEHIAGRARMVNPAKLSADRRDSVCAQCHLFGEARVPRPGKDPVEFRAGELFSDYAAVFVYGGDRGLKATSYVEKLAASKCKIASGERLWCGTCHDPHTVPAPAERVAWYRGKCETCHAGQPCGRGPDCAGCHMPKARVQDVNHGMLTDHGIRRTADVVIAGAKRDWHLRSFFNDAGGNRELGIAYADVAQRTGDMRQEQEGFRLLSHAPKDSDTELRLAAVYRHRGETAQAIEQYRAVLGANPNSILALVNLGNTYGSMGNLDDAVSLWRRALTRNPCQPEAVANLEKVYMARNQAAELEKLRASQARCVFDTREK